MIVTVKIKNCNFSNISDFRYHIPSETMEIQMTDGKTYQYFDVPKEIACRGFSAVSLGSWLNRVIRGHYRYCRV